MINKLINDFRKKREQEEYEKQKLEISLEIDIMILDWERSRQKVIKGFDRIEAKKQLTKAYLQRSNVLFNPLLSSAILEIIQDLEIDLAKKPQINVRGGNPV